RVKNSRKYDRTDVIYLYQGEDDIRNRNVTGVQTCAHPILKVIKKKKTIIKMKIMKILMTQSLMVPDETVGENNNSNKNNNETTNNQNNTANEKNNSNNEN